MSDPQMPQYAMSTWTSFSAGSIWGISPMTTVNGSGICNCRIVLALALLGAVIAFFAVSFSAAFFAEAALATFLPMFNTSIVAFRETPRLWCFVRSFESDHAFMTFDRIQRHIPLNLVMMKIATKDSCRSLVQI